MKTIESGRNRRPQGRVHQLVIQHQTVSSKPIRISSIQTEEADFRNIDEYMHVITVIEKRGHESEREQGGGIGGHRGRKWKGEHDIIMYNIKQQKVKIISMWLKLAMDP